MKLNAATILVEPRTLFREGLACVLSKTSYRPIKCVASIADLPQDLSADARDLLFIVSIEACQNADGGAALCEGRALRQQYPHARLIVLSESFNIRHVIAALHAGANGYILYTITPDALVKSLDLVMLGGTVLPSEFPRAIFEEKNWMSSAQVPAPAASMLSIDVVPSRPDRLTHVPKLSSKETEILSRLTIGASNKDIARSAGMAEATVKTHIKAILRKINVSNRTQAALWALKHMRGVLEQGPEPPA